MKRFITKRSLKGATFAIAIAAAFLIGYGVAAKAWPGVPDRNQLDGYFYAIHDTSGDDIFEGGFPDWVNNANAFISFLRGKLYNGNPRDQIGAAFIIQTMRGEAGGWARGHPPNDWEMADWEAGVRYAESRGWIAWYANFTYTGNSLWQGNNGGGPNPNDDAFYYENGTRISMVFRNSNGLAYAIKRDCGNPLTYGYMPGLERNWTSSARSTVSGPAAYPGQTIKFSHFVKNNGPGAALIWWTTFDTLNSRSLVSGGPNVYQPGQEINVNNEFFTIPTNATANQRYCRHVGWDPTNSFGGRYGNAAPACVTVFIPQKLKAVMTASPATIVNGDTTTFTPSIVVQSSGSPTLVHCTITRTLTQPGGGPSNLGNQPCVDGSGNPDITVTGGGVTLKPNNYTAPDNVPVGSKICDTINIVLPVEPGFFNNPADRTATFCVTVAKTPYVRFMGNDVFAGGNFQAVNAACNNQANITTNGRALQDGSYAGSVAEYDVFALGKISSFGSASKVLVGSGALGDASRSMTFANSEPDASKLGYFGAAQHCINDYISQYNSSPTIAAGAYNVGGRGSGQWHVTGALSLSGGMPAGGQQVYYADGDVTITGNLTYPATYANAAAIPSLLVITKGNVYVAPTVSQMDGIFVARGNGNTNGVFYTCWPKNEPASITNACNSNSLTVNGSVLAGRIDLFRSFGATGGTPDARKAAAEQFNFSPELYLHNVINTSGQTTIQTSNELELPPRF